MTWLIVGSGRQVGRDPVRDLAYDQGTLRFVEGLVGQAIENPPIDAGPAEECL